MGEDLSNRKDKKDKDEGGGALGQARGFWQQFQQYAYEVKTETKRVTWPGKQEIYGTTVMVILTTFLFGIYFAVCDRTFGFAIKNLLDYLRHR